MKIRKHGNRYTKVKSDSMESFKCENCSCEFSAKEDEVYTDYGGAEHYVNGWISTINTISSVTKDYLVCSCPECHKICKKIRERKNDSFTTTPVTYTYTNTHGIQLDNDSDKLPTDYVKITCAEDPGNTVSAF